MREHGFMAKPNVDAEVIGLLADERGLPREKVQPSARLLHDLGMDGDDAVDFFNSVHERFGTDLTNLYEDWSNHFGPEGFSCWNGVIILPAALVGGLIAGAADLSAFSGVVVTITLLGAWVWAIRRWGPPDKIVPVTVSDVIAAVENGAWPRRSDDQSSSS
jgi:acyl carrier protein